MFEALKSLKLVADALRQGNCGQAISKMENFLSAWPERNTDALLAQIKGDYLLMVDYWRRGASDPERPAIYQRLLQRMYVLWSNVQHYHSMRNQPFLSSLYTRVRKEQREWTLASIRSEMENFVSSVALLQLEPEHERQQKSEALYRDHQQQMSRLFEYVLTSRQWTDHVGSAFADMLTSPTVDTIDQQLLVSAITLSGLMHFDMSKLRTLVEVFRLSQDEAVRQRALVGWLLAMNDDFAAVYPEQHELVAELLEDDAVCQQVTELQIQFVYCMNEQRDTDTIRHEIMPDLMENNSFRVTSKGIEEVDDDPLEDVLHPDAADERMEKLERSFRRMADMQKQGSDIYFGGFSQMKRFPFFYDMSNWLVPFYRQHPDIAQQAKSMEGVKLIERMLDKGPFCSSDKYSLVLVFQQVLNRMPDNLRQMLKQGEATMAGEMPDDEELHSPAFIRRLYLMDLYRFFRLFPHRSELPILFADKFALPEPALFFGSDILCDTPLDRYKPDVVRMLLKHGYNAGEVLRTFTDDMKNAQYFVWLQDYDRALELEPYHVHALLGRAREKYEEGFYDEALADYEKLLEKRPDNKGILLKKAACLLELNDNEGALKILFKLNYEQPEDESTNRVLAWALLCDNRLEQADRLYRKLMEADRPDKNDVWNAGYCLWLQGHIDEAAIKLRGCRYLEELWLEQHGIGKVEIQMMQALIDAD